jgi:3-hydroxyisobutyrate dehydrogenase-like beta-hydroxyacid dehydrogenase
MVSLNSPAHARALFFQAIEGGPLDLPYLRMKGRAIAERDFTPSFRLRLAAKDAGLATDATWQYGLDLPLIEVIAGAPLASGTHVPPAHHVPSGAAALWAT